MSQLEKDWIFPQSYAFEAEVVNIYLVGVIHLEVGPILRL